MSVFTQAGIILAVSFNYAVFCQEFDSSATSSYGVPLTYQDASLTVGPRGPLVVEDVEFLNQVGHFDRERIPPRVVHAKGVGARGYFEVTKNITRYSAAKLFSSIGKKTPIFVRFSRIFADGGAADTERDIRGFAIKFYTEDGIWDLLGNNFPVFYINDPILFPSLIHALRRHPTTNLFNVTTAWDFYTLRQEGTLTVLWLYSDLGIPYNLRQMNGYGVNTFKLVNAEGNHVYCKFHYHTNQGIRNLTNQEAARVRSVNSDFYQTDMLEAINSRNYPSWTFYIQVMTQEQADSANFNPFDDTRTWPENIYPLIEVGRFVLTKNPVNYFAEVEQIAFSPSRMVPGIRPSVDKILQGRLFAYGDTQFYRVGTNYLQLPINRPISPPHNYERDGSMEYYNQGGAVNYHPDSFGGPNGSLRADHLMAPYNACGLVFKYDIVEDKYSQATQFYRYTLDKKGRNNLISNMVDDLKNVARFIQIRAIMMLENVDVGLARRIANKLGIASPT